MQSLEITSLDFKTRYLADPDSFEVIDVREPSEYAEGHIRGSKLIPMGKLERKLDDIDWSREVIFVCRSGNRSMQVVHALRDFDYLCRSLAGGVSILAMNGVECME